MTHSLPGHEQATHFMLSGVNALPAGATHMASRDDWPCYASGVQYLRPRADGLPSGVLLPTYLHNGYGFSGQNGGFLGSKFDPWQLTRDPNAADFRLQELDLLPELTVDRLSDRRSLLAKLDDKRRNLAASCDRPGPFGTVRQRVHAPDRRGPVPRSLQSRRRAGRIARPLRPPCVRTIAAPCAAARRGGHAGRAGQHGLDEQLGHARLELRAAQRPLAASVRPGARRRCWKT